MTAKNRITHDDRQIFTKIIENTETRILPPINEQTMEHHNQQKLTCKLTTPELQKRRATVIADLENLLLSKEEISNGYKYFFSSEDAVLDQLLGFIKSERLCCDFFEFTLHIVNEDAILEISGPEGSKEFLDHEVGF